jgi:CheY-like chemotaxis protein
MNILPILLVDDDIVDRLSLERWCKKHFIQYQIANNGLEALNLAMNNHYSMILSDIDMPIMNGIKLTQEIMKMEQTSNHHLPVVAISGNEILGLNSQFKNFGFDYFISKPAKMEDLDILLKRYCIDNVDTPFFELGLN